MGTMGTMKTLKNPTAWGGPLRDDKTPAFGRSVADGSHADTHRHPPTPTDTHRHPPTPTDTHRHPPTPTNTRRVSPPPPPPGTSARASTRALARRHRRRKRPAFGCCGRICSCVESRQLKSSRPPSIKYTFKVVCDPLRVWYPPCVKVSITGLKCRSLG